jgi:CBS domain-containing protein
LPVLKNKTLVGIITRSDILDFVLNGSKKRTRQAARAAAKPRKSIKKRVRHK